MTMPCSCCPLPEGCFQVWTPALRALVLNGAHTEVFTGGPGVVPIGGPGSAVGLLRWSDGDITGANYTGYTSPAVQLTAATSPTIILEFAAIQDRVRGLREWNQGGGDLNDSDGFSQWTVEFLNSSGTVLATGTHVMSNGGAPFDFLLPGSTFLNGVKAVRLSDMRKLNPGSPVSPLVREVQALTMTPQPVYPCRMPDGTIHWYDSTGTEVLAADVFRCPCPGECWTEFPSEDLTANPFLLRPVDGLVHNLVTATAANPVFLQMPDRTGPSQCGPPEPVEATLFRVSGGGQGSILADGTLAFSGGGNQLYQVNFWRPVDLRLELTSYQCLAAQLERFAFEQVPNEFIAGPGSSLATNPLGYPAGTTYCDGNNGPSYVIYRNVTSVQWRQLPHVNFTSITRLHLLEAVPGWQRVSC